MLHAYVMQNYKQHRGRLCSFMYHSQSEANHQSFRSMQKRIMKDDGVGWFGIERNGVESNELKDKDRVTSSTRMYIIVYSPPLFFLASSGAVIQVSSESKCTSPFVG